MEQRPSERELDEQMKKICDELKFRGVYDDLRKQLLGKVEEDRDYQDLLQRVKDFSNRFFHKSRYVEGGKGITRQKLKTGIHDSNTISRYTTDLARDMIYEIEDFKLKDYIRSEMEKYFGLESENNPSTSGISTKKGCFENTFVQEESSSTSFAQHTLPDSSSLPVHSDQSFQGPENDPESSNISFKNDDSRGPFSANPTSFSLNRPTMLEMDKISDDEDYDLDDTSLPSPPKMEQFSPLKVNEPSIHEEESMDLEENSPTNDETIQQISTSDNDQKIDISGSESNSAFASIAQSSTELLEDNKIDNSSNPSNEGNLSLPISGSVKDELLEETSSFPQNIIQFSSQISEEIKIDEKDKEKEDEVLEDVTDSSDKKTVQISEAISTENQKDNENSIENVSEKDKVIVETKVEPKDNTEVTIEKIKTDSTPQKSRPPRDSKSQAEILLDRLIAEDAKNSYSDCDISEISSVHSSDLSEFDDKIVFSDSDCEDFNGIELDKLKLAIDDPERFVDFMKSRTEIKINDSDHEKMKISDDDDDDFDDDNDDDDDDESKNIKKEDISEEVEEEEVQKEERMEDEEEEEEEDEEKEEKVEKKKYSKRKGRGRKSLKKKNNNKKKESLKRTNSEDSASTFRKSRRRTISSSTDSSILSKPRIDTSESKNKGTHETNTRKKRQRIDSQCSNDSSLVTSNNDKIKDDCEASQQKKLRTSRKQQQSYDASDLYKPRTSNLRSNRRSNRSSLYDNPQSPLSTASNSTS